MTTYDEAWVAEEQAKRAQAEPKVVFEPQRPVTRT